MTTGHRRGSRPMPPFVRGIAVVGVAIVVVLGLAIVYARHGTPAASGSVPAATMATSAAPPVTPTPSASRSSTPSAKPSHPRTPGPSPKKSPKPVPTRKKVSTPVPPKPSPSPVPGCSKPFYIGSDAPMPDVRTALTTAASTHVWTVSKVDLPPELIYAVAWQESGWQSAIRACDGGIGTMQVMPDTANQMNQRFDAHWDVTTLDGNTMIGSAYLQWLIKYLGDSYFNGDYSVDASACVSDDPTVPDYTTPCLLNAVIAAYNFGAGAVGKDTIVIPNPGYVSDVRALMTSCTCLAE